MKKSINYDDLRIIKELSKELNEVSTYAFDMGNSAKNTEVKLWCWRASSKISEITAKLLELERQLLEEEHAEIMKDRRKNKQ